MNKLHNVLLITDGRDKFLKIIQYACKLYVLQSQSSVLTKEGKSSLQKISNLVSALSNARKMVRLLHCIQPWQEVQSILKKGFQQQDVETQISLLNNSLSVLNDISDDIVALCKVGVLDKSHSARFEFYSNNMWFLCICLDLRDIIKTYRSLMAQKSVDQQKLLYVKVSIVKLLGDFGFCAYDVFQLKFSDRFQASCAFTAALCGFYKLWLKQK
ncbi:hypothetical protein MP228_005739 [Amoeboaphelidium protococcarum]|nr:hypothetical protein MP228_005739 [Amoeboaphelidium protococcarum]